VELLHVRDDVNPDKPDNKSKTPRRSPSSNGQEVVVRLQLAWDDVDPDKSDNIAKTLLWGASRDRHEGVVNLLFAQDDVNPDRPDTDGGIPLLWPS